MFSSPKLFEARDGPIGFWGLGRTLLLLQVALVLLFLPILMVKTINPFQWGYGSWSEEQQMVVLNDEENQGLVKVEVSREVWDFFKRWFRGFTKQRALARVG